MGEFKKGLKFLAPLFHAILGVLLILLLPLAIIDLGPILSIYGLYALFLATFGIFGVVGAIFSHSFLIRIFVIWTRISVLISILITISFALLLDFHILESNFCSDHEWICILIISFVGTLCFIISLLGFRIKYSSEDPEKTPLTRKRQLTVSRDEVKPTGVTFSHGNHQAVRTIDPKRRSVIKFNSVHIMALPDLVEAGVIPSNSPQDVAMFLYNEENLNPITAGEFLAINSPYNKSVLSEFANCFDFEAMEFDEALRVFFSKFRLPGEAQKIDRIMEQFANRYYDCNPHKFSSPDTAFILSFSLIMLNTDLHNPNIKSKLSLSDFIKNNRGIDDGGDLSSAYLEKLYNNILKKEIKLGSNIIFHSAKKGWLNKLGNNRKWQRRWVVVSQNCLFYFKDENDCDPDILIPLEGLEVEENTQFEHSFDLYNPNEEFVKASKLKSGAKQGKHGAYTFCAPSDPEKEDWMRIIRENIVSNPMMEHQTPWEGV